eukprot:1280295-Rhodomonas_salina.1
MAETESRDACPQNTRIRFEKGKNRVISEETEKEERGGGQRKGESSLVTTSTGDARYPPTRLLRGACYAVSGTEIAYAARAALHRQGCTLKRQGVGSRV